MRKKNTQRLIQWFQNHGSDRLTKSIGALPSKKKTIDFMKGTRPKMPEWRMYGQMHPDKMKPLVDEAFEVVRQEHNAKPKVFGKDTPKMPIQMSSWSIVAQELYANETAEVKARVAAAVKEQVDKAKLVREDLPFEATTERRVAKLES